MIENENKTPSNKWTMPYWMREYALLITPLKRSEERRTVEDFMNHPLLSDLINDVGEKEKVYFVVGQIVMLEILNRHKLLEKRISARGYYRKTKDLLHKILKEEGKPMDVEEIREKLYERGELDCSYYTSIVLAHEVRRKTAKWKRIKKGIYQII